MNGTVVLSAVGLILAFTLMAILIFKKVSPLLLGPLAAILVCLMSGLPVLDTVVDTYVPGVGGFFVSYFLIFLLGNLLGSLYQLSGAASRIGELISQVFGAKRVVNCMIACLLAPAILSYGGINSFVIIFAMYPIALRLFQEADVSTDLLPGIVCGGMWTFAMTGPFTPQIPNVVSMDALGTPSYAGLIPGIAASAAMGVLIVWYMTRAAKKSQAAGKHFVLPANAAKVNEGAKPGSLVSFLPLAVVLVGFNVTSHLFASATKNTIVWLIVGVALALILFWKCLPKGELRETLNSAAGTSVSVIMNTAAIVGFGAVVKLTPVYAFAVGVLEGSTANPYVVAAVGSNIFAGILGSSSGGLALMYSSLKDVFLSYGARGYSLEFIHRLCSFGSGGLDSMPWNGSIVSIFQVCGTDHQRSYKYNFVTCAIIPVACTFLIALPLCMLLG